MLWGVSVALFGVASYPILIKGGLNPTQAILWVGILNVIIDCVMTLFGSTSNDACYSSYITDQTDETNRPMVESVISILPLTESMASVDVFATLVICFLSVDTFVSILVAVSSIFPETEFNF